MVFSLFCVAIVISEPFFARAYFRPDFAAIRREKFAARYFWFKVARYSFLSEYLSRLSVNYVAINKDLEKLTLNSLKFSKKFIERFNNYSLIC